MKETSIRDLANILCSLYPEKGLQAKCLETKDDNSYIRSKSQRASLDNTKLKSLGWKEIIPVEVGFKRMIESYRKLK